MLADEPSQRRRRVCPLCLQKIEIGLTLGQARVRAGRTGRGGGLRLLQGFQPLPCPVNIELRLSLIPKALDEPGKCLWGALPKHLIIALPNVGSCRHSLLGEVRVEGLRFPSNEGHCGQERLIPLTGDANPIGSGLDLKGLTRQTFRSPVEVHTAIRLDSTRSVVFCGASLLRKTLTSFCSPAER